MDSRILITCTQPRADDYVTSLNNYPNLLAVSCPALIKKSIEASVPKGKFDAMVITSAHAISDCLPDIPAIAVGKHTADMARSMGLNIIHEGTGGIEDLDLTSYEHILYPCASEPTYIPDNASPWAIYETHTNPDFFIPPDVQAICIFSIKAAHIIKDKIQPHQTALCLSKAIADMFNHKLAVTVKPSYDAMTQLILDFSKERT